MIYVKRKKKNNEMAHSRLGLKTCAGFLAFMLIMTGISKWISWEMKPEVTICDSEYKEMKQVNWAVGSIGSSDLSSILNGQTEYSSNSSSKEVKPKVEAYTEEGKIDLKETKNVKLCLFKITYDYGKSANVIPMTSVRDEGGLSKKVYSVDVFDNKINPYIISDNTVSINNQTENECDLTSSLKNVVVESSKSINEGTNVRIKLDDTLDQNGRVELVPKDGAFFTSTYPLWMLKVIFPHGTKFEEKEAGNYTRITMPVEKGETIQEVKSLLKNLYGITHLDDNTREYLFLECNRYLKLPNHVVVLVIMMMISVILLLMVFWDLIIYERILRRKCLEEGIMKCFNEELIGILTRLIFYSIAFIIIFLLFSNISTYNFDLVGRWLPEERVLDFQHYKNIYHEWLSDKNYYLSLYTEGKGTDYYQLLSRKWNELGHEVVGILITFYVLLIIIKRLFRSKMKRLKL